ncbi:MAG: helix-turn-helix domain-containing protein [Polyangiales bacterium]
MRFRHEVLQAARLELGLTQEELAESLGVAARTYRRYESGAVNAGGFTLRNASRQSLLDRMNAELGTSLAELVETETKADAHHILQPARHFVGRSQELGGLHAFRASHAPGVLAVVGVGGAGKTALVEHYLRTARADLVYSFYEDRRVEPFLEAAAKLRDGALVVLDGAEVLQVAFADGFAHGELTEPALRDWLRGVAAGRGALQAIVTSRFPLVDLDAFAGRGFEVINLGPLKSADVAALLGAWGVTDTAPLGALAGGHALSAAVLGSYVGGFLQGELPKEWRFEEAASDDPLARRLQAVLTSYRSALPEDTVAVLARLAEAASGVRVAKEDRVHLRRLVRLGLVFTLGTDRFAMHPFVRDALRARSEDQATLTRVPGMARSEMSALLHVEREIQRALDQDDIAHAVLLYRRELGGFDQLGLKLGEYALGRRVLAQLEPRLEGQRGTLGERSVARLIYDQGLYSGALGDLRHAIRCYERIVERANIDTALRTTALRAQAYSLRLLGDAGQALAIVDEALALSRAAGERPHEGRAHALRGAILSDLERSEEAARAFARSEELSGPMVARRALWRAEFDLQIGDALAARERTLANRRVCADLAWPGHVAHCEAVLAFAALADGEGDAAAHLQSLSAWTERTQEAEFVARADALAHRLDASCGAKESFLRRPSTRELQGLMRWFTRRVE